MNIRVRSLVVSRLPGVVGRIAALTLALATIQENTALAHIGYPPHDKEAATEKSNQENDTTPPYEGTAFLGSDVITPSDVSSLIDVTYAGRGKRTVFDRRPADWIEITAYLFNAHFDDALNSEIQVNPEFGSVSAAEEAAVKYAKMVGQLPTALRADVDTVTIHKGEASWGGGNNNILIHADNYANDPYFRDFEEEVLIHESAHTSLDADHAEAPDWLAAQVADVGFISTYARDHPLREDIAESVLPWLALRYRSDRISGADSQAIQRAIPNRLAYFDRTLLDREMYPMRDRVSNTLPFILSASSSGQQSFVRIRNRSEVAGVVTISAIDDEGERFGPVTLHLPARRSVGLNSEDLEKGNTGQGLSSGVGDGAGHWRLEFNTSLEIEARAYIRTAEGLLTSMYQTAREHERMKRRYVVPFFNPASNRSIRSLLRIGNPNAVCAKVRLEAWDSHDQAAEGPVEFSLPPGAAVLVSSQDLEAGDSETFTGRLGDGEGKWRFELSAGDLPLEVMSLLSTRSGHLTNLSR